MDGLTLTHKPIPHHTLPNLNRGQDTRANRTRPPRTPRLYRQSFHFVTEDTGPRAGHTHVATFAWASLS